MLAYSSGRNAVILFFTPFSPSFEIESFVVICIVLIQILSVVCFSFHIQISAIFFDLLVGDGDAQTLLHWYKGSKLSGLGPQ